MGEECSLPYPPSWDRSLPSAALPPAPHCQDQLPDVEGFPASGINDTKELHYYIMMMMMMIIHLLYIKPNYPLKAKCSQSEFKEDWQEEMALARKQWSI